jgi:hypothetical protein
VEVQGLASRHAQRSKGRSVGYHTIEAHRKPRWDCHVTILRSSAFRSGAPIVVLRANRASNCTVSLDTIPLSVAPHSRWGEACASPLLLSQTASPASRPAPGQTIPSTIRRATPTVSSRSKDFFCSAAISTLIVKTSTRQNIHISRW